MKSRGGAATFFIFLAAATRTRVIPTRLRSLMAHGGGALAKWQPEILNGEHALAEHVCNFYEAISEWAEENSEERDNRLTILIQAIRDHVGLVVIDVSKEDDAQVIFETLNARGTPLLPSDLVKNHLFHHAELDGERLDLLYKQYRSIWV